MNFSQASVNLELEKNNTTDDKVHVVLYNSTGHEVIKLFSCSTQLSTKFQLLIKTEIPTNEDISCFKSLRCCIYHANKC